MSRRARAVAAVLGLGFVLTSAGMAGLVGDFALCAALLPVLLASASGRRALMRRLRALVPLLLGLLLSLTLFAAMSGDSGWNAWSERIYLMSARVLAATLILSWLTHDLSAAQLESALHALRLPRSFVFLVMETRAFAAQLSETLEAAWAACALRGGLGSFAALRQTVGAVAGVVILRSIDRSERVAQASALRGFAAEPAADSGGEARVALSADGV